MTPILNNLIPEDPTSLNSLDTPSQNQTDEVARQRLDNWITKWIDENPHAANEKATAHLRDYIAQIENLENVNTSDLPPIDLSHLDEDAIEVLKDGLEALKMKLKSLTETESAQLNYHITTHLTIFKILSDITSQHLDHLRKLIDNQIAR